MILKMLTQIRKDSETDCFAARCPELDIYSAGRTADDAKDALRDAVLGFMTICAERGILLQELRKRGLVVIQSFDELPDDQIEVPLSLIIMGEEARARNQASTA